MGAVATRMLRALLPKEHGLWSWAGVPLVAAVLLAPVWTTGVGALAILLLFGSANAARKAEKLAAGVAGAAGLALGVGLAPALAQPALWLSTLGGLGAGGAVALVVVGRATGRKAPNATLLELAAIGGFTAAGAGLAIANGAMEARTALVALALGTWQVIGLWWVRGELARVLPGRTPWTLGPAVIATLAITLVISAVSLGHPAVIGVPALYMLRARLTRPAASARDARRIGLSEAGWAIVAVLAAVGASAMSLG